jgi:antitoxin HicB
MESMTLDHYLAIPYTIEIIPDEEDGGYVARVQELPGCLTQADSWEELSHMIEDAKRLWLESALEHGEPIPEPIGVFR